MALDGPEQLCSMVLEEARSGDLVWDPAPPEPGIEGAGTVHHIAFRAPNGPR